MDTSVIDKLRQWLVTYPNWAEGGLLYIDFTDGTPGCAGLYPTGLEELSRMTNVMGGITVRNRCNFLLYRVTEQQEDNEANAQWLLEFQQWVQQQSAAGLAPSFGDEPAQERVYAYKGKLKESDQTGTGIYTVNLSAEFTKYY